MELITIFEISLFFNLCVLWKWLLGGYHNHVDLKTKSEAFLSSFFFGLPLCYYLVRAGLDKYYESLDSSLWPSIIISTLSYAIGYAAYWLSKTKD